MSDKSVPRKSRFWRIFAMWIFGPLLVLAIGCVALIRNPPQSLLLGVLAKEFRQQTGYGVGFGTASSVTLWPDAKLDLRDVKVRRPSLKKSRGGVVADAVRVTASFNIQKWLRGDRSIDAVLIETPTVTLFQTDLRQLNAGSGIGKSAVQIRQVTVKDGFVSYHERPTNPEFSASKIQAALTDVGAGRIGKFSGRFEWRDAAIKLSGTMARSGAKQSDLSFDLKAPTTKVVFNGTAHDDATTRIEGKADIHVTSLDELTRWLNIDHGPEHLALSGKATIAGPVAFSARQIWLKGADVTTAIAQGKVDVAIDLRGARPRLTGEAAWQRLDLNAFTTPKPKLTGFAVSRRTGEPAAAEPAPAVTIPSAWQDLDAYLKTLNQPVSIRSLEPSPTKPPPPGKSPLSPLAIDFSAINRGDMELLQTAETLLINGWEVKDVTIDSRLDAGRLSLDVSQATFASGQWKAKLDIDGRAAKPEHALSISGAGVDVKELLTMTVGPATLEGRSTFKADLSARGGTLDAVVQSLSGKANIDLNKGRFIGFDLKAVLNRWWRKWAYDTRRTTPFDRLRARLRVNKGVVKTIGPATLRGQYVEVDTNGTVSLARRRLNQRVRARLAPPPSQLPIPVRISGLWTKPVIKLDFGLFSLEPGRYEMPFAIDPIAAARQTRSFATSAVEQMPAALQDKVRQALEDPTKAQKIPKRLRDALAKFVR